MVRASRFDGEAVGAWFCFALSRANLKEGLPILIHDYDRRPLPTIEQGWVCVAVATATQHYRRDLRRTNGF